MPLSLGRCGTLGGDVEMAAVVKTLAQRHPADTFVLIGRNDGSRPTDVGLPDNVENPWIEWAPRLRREINDAQLNHANLSSVEQLSLQDIFDALTLPTILDLDAIILWVGQHGTTNTPIPRVDDRDQLTKPYDWCAYYCSYLFRGVNLWRDVDPWKREEVYLNADSRNRHKMRDLKWPLRHPVLTQFTFHHPLKHERYDDTGGWSDWERETKNEVEPLWDAHDDATVWRSTVHNVYSRLEVNGLLPGTPFGDLISYDEEWDHRDSFGMFINEASPRTSDATRRRDIVRDWVLPLAPKWVHGTWSDVSQTHLNRRITPAPWAEYYPLLHSVRSTFTTPSSGSGWATAKPWEAFAAGTVCFFHPLYDTQNNVLGDAAPYLRDWLRADSPGDLHRRVTHLNSDAGRHDWLHLVRAQRVHFGNALTELRYVRLIEERVWPVTS
jgi:hypothetical protein